MDVFIVVLLSSILVISMGNWMSTVKGHKKPLDASKPVIEAVGDEHRLVRTWIEYGDGSADGWRWKCSCGVMGLSSGIRTATAKENGSLGAEQFAIDRFKIHAQGYREANGNAWKDKHDEVQAKFDAFVKSCYCKDTLHHQLERP